MHAHDSSLRGGSMGDLFASLVWMIEVVGWVTTSESQLMKVLVLCFVPML